MDLEGIILNEISQRNTVQYHLYMEPKKVKLIETESRAPVITRGWGLGEIGEMLVKGYKLPVIGQISSGNHHV